MMFKVGDHVWYYQRLRGEKFTRRVTGIIKQTDGTFARLERTDGRFEMVTKVSVEVKRLRKDECD